MSSRCRQLLSPPGHGGIGRGDSFGARKTLSCNAQFAGGHGDPDRRYLLRESGTGRARGTHRIFVRPSSGKGGTVLRAGYRRFPCITQHMFHN
ncbi:MAG: hypothetical protein ACKO5K_04115, partial [Armatimonadota bacterium]